jgi:hypothetical protein
MNEYQILIDLRTYVDESLEDLWLTLNFVPQIGSNIFLDEADVKLPESMKGGTWFKIAEVDYQLKDNIFIVGLMELNQFNEQKAKEQ